MVQMFDRDLHVCNMEEGGNHWRIQEGGGGGQGVKCVVSMHLKMVVPPFFLLVTTEVGHVGGRYP